MQPIVYLAINQSMISYLMLLRDVLSGDDGGGDRGGNGGGSGCAAAGVGIVGLNKSFIKQLFEILDC